MYYIHLLLLTSSKWLLVSMTTSPWLLCLCCNLTCKKMKISYKFVTKHIIIVHWPIHTVVSKQLSLKNLHESILGKYLKRIFILIELFHVLLVWIIFFVTFLAILQLSHDTPVVSGLGNMSNLQNPPPNYKILEWSTVNSWKLRPP